MTTFPNYQSSITAYKALELIKKAMPNINTENSTVTYTDQNEILSLDIENFNIYKDVCSLLNASGLYVKNSLRQTFYNLGAYKFPVYTWKDHKTNPRCRQSVLNGGSFVILDKFTNEIIDVKHFIRHPLTIATQKNTHFLHLCDAVAELKKLQDTETPINHLRIVEIQNGVIV